jgi:hypothetical protein
MSANRPRMPRAVNHSTEPLLHYVVVDLNRSSTKTLGPIPEFLARKEAEQAPKTFEWYRDSLTQLWAFLEETGHTTIGDFDDRAVNLFRLNLRKRGVSDNRSRPAG